VEFVFALIRRRAAFVYPVPPAPPTAVLVPWFKSQWSKSQWFKSQWSRARGVVRVFDRGWNSEAEAYRPAAIAGTWRQMESLLSHQIASLTHAVIVLARPDDSLLTTDQRQQLWSAYRVPVFEQIIGEHGTLLAAECEAHDGLHIESPKLDLADLSVERGACGCGRTTPRIRSVRQIEEIRAVAAYAR
jgi:hypothetical protein